MGYDTSGESDGLGFGLNFLMTPLGSINEVEALVCTSRSIKNEDMYLGCSEMGGGGIGGNGEVHNEKYGMRLPTKTPKILL